MTALDLKLLRDLKGMRLQALAIALVIAGGIAMFIMSLSSLDSLFQTRERYYRDFHGPGTETHSYSTSGGFADFADSEDILREIFGRGGAEGRVRLRGQDVLYRLPVEFLEAVNGGTKRISMPDGGTVEARGAAAGRGIAGRLRVPLLADYRSTGSQWRARDPRHRSRPSGRCAYRRLGHRRRQG